MSRKIWATPQQLWEDFIKYADSRKNRKRKALNKQGTAVEIDSPLPITIEGFCTWKNISRQSFYRYREYDNRGADKLNETNDRYCDTIARIEQYIEAYTNDMAATGQFEGRWYELYMKNKFGYTDRQDIATDTQITVNFNIPRPGAGVLPTVDITPKLGGKRQQNK